MNPELRALLKQVADKLNEYISPATADHDKRRGEVLDAIRKEHHDILWQPIANVGFAAGRAARDGEVADLTNKVTAAESKIKTVETDLAGFRDKNRDIAAVQDEAARKIAEANQRAADATTAAEKKIEGALRDRDVTAFESRLLAGGMDADYAKSQGILLRERMAYKDGTLSVMQPGSANIPYTVHGDELLTVLAGEVLKKSPASAFTSKVDSGGGTGGSGGQGGAGGTGGSAGSFWEGIRKEEEQRAAADKSGRVSPAAAYGSRGLEPATR